MTATQILQTVGGELARAIKNRRGYRSDSQMSCADGRVWATTLVLREYLPTASTSVRRLVGQTIRQELNLEGRLA